MLKQCASWIFRSGRLGTAYYQRQKSHINSGKYIAHPRILLNSFQGQINFA